jgi:hypothetical protein
MGLYNFMFLNDTRHDFGLLDMYVQNISALNFSRPRRRKLEHSRLNPKTEMGSNLDIVNLSQEAHESLPNPFG